MYYGAIKDCDIANGDGVRVSLFVSGCRNHCPGCFQPETWAFDYGEPYTDETMTKILDMLKPDYINGLTVLGGDPFEPENQPQVAILLTMVRAAYPTKNIWIYTGYTWERLHTVGSPVNILAITERILRLTDILVDGPFVEEEKDISLRFRGSRNQRIIDVPKTLISGQITLADKYYRR